MDEDCQVAVVYRMMIDVVVDDVLELNGDDKHHRNDLVDEYANNIEDEDVLDVSMKWLKRV